MYKLKEMAKRSTSLVAAVSLLGGVGASAFPALASADALNPLTERSLTLSSSSPGWSYLDGSGNTTYAPPNSGANGQKTGNTYTFRVSSNGKNIKAMTFQYCTTPAGDCTAPGNDASATVPGVDDATHTDLNIVNNGSQRVLTSGEYTSVAASADKTPAAGGTEGNFVVLYGASAGGSAGMTYNAPGGTPTAWTWTSASNYEPGATTPTGKNNFTVIKNTNGQSINAGDYFKIVFYGTDANYITNPGAGAFFVRINTYSDDTTLDDTTIVDGGVTVANVMNESISIQTKVLETMAFSVGTHDPNLYNTATDTVFTGNTGINSHGQCDSILQKDPHSGTYSTDAANVLKLGDSTAEFSLTTGQAYEVNSYWRLSSNSSGGATVYYTGHTLTNTVGDQINPLQDSTSDIGAGLGTQSHPGTEQFGLAIAQNGDATKTVFGDTYGSTSTAGDFAKYVADTADNTIVHTPGLAPLVPLSNYGNGAGGTTNVPAVSTGFAFNANSDTYAVPIARETTDVVNCVTAKMRYIANIAATTPAGIYTTKVNYVASPQY